MKISEITIEDLKEYMRVIDDEEDKFINTIMIAAKNYIRNYTGLTFEQMDEKEDLTLAVYVLCSELYDNRQYSVQNEKVNVVVKSILDMHSINLI